MEYIVTRWPDSPATASKQVTITVTLTATSHIDALYIQCQNIYFLLVHHFDKFFMAYILI